MSVASGDPPRASRGLTARPSSSAWLSFVRRVTRGRYAGVLGGLIVVCIYLGLTEPIFLNWDNWENIIRTESVVLTLGIGMTFVVLTGGIDLSIASATTAAGMLLGIAIEHGASW